MKPDSLPLCFVLLDICLDNLLSLSLLESRERLDCLRSLLSVSLLRLLPFSELSNLHELERESVVDFISFEPCCASFSPRHTQVVESMSRYGLLLDSYAFPYLQGEVCKWKAFTTYSKGMVWKAENQFL